MQSPRLSAPQGDPGEHPHHGQAERPSGVSVPAPGQVPGPLASFPARAISFLIDYAAPVIVLTLLLAVGVTVTTGGTTVFRVLTVPGGLALLGFEVWNSGYLQGTTGRSLGRRVANTTLVTIETGQPVGFGRAVARQLCHGLEFGIGWLWPLWDGRRQTFADKIVGTVVIRVDEPTEDRSGTDERRLVR